MRGHGSTGACTWMYMRPRGPPMTKAASKSSTAMYEYYKPGSRIALNIFTYIAGALLVPTGKETGELKWDGVVYKLQTRHEKVF